MEDILDRSFSDGRLGPNIRKDPQELTTFRRELMFCSLMVWEYTDAGGPFCGDVRLERIILPVLERIGKRLPYQAFDGRIAGPGAYFCLVPFTRSLLRLEGIVAGKWRQQRIDEADALAACAAAGMQRPHDYLNARALECAAALNLYRLTGLNHHMERCTECLDEMLRRQYPCGAQPYHTGMWVWGRRPAHVYQLLAASMTLSVARSLGRTDAEEYVRRIMDFSMLATGRRGEAFVTCFEGLHKARSLACAGRQWVCGAALGDVRFAGLARRAYEIYSEGIINDPFCRHENFRHEVLAEAMELGLTGAPAPVPFAPSRGIHALRDISTLCVHEENLDLSMTLLTGYSAFAEGDAGNVKLFALTPELTGEPTHGNCGTDALRADWHKPTEQLACSADGASGVLSGWVYTKWDSRGERDTAFVHNRRLAVTMSYRHGEMRLAYQTITNWRPAQVPSRLLLLLSSRPFDRPGELTLGGKAYATPPAESEETFHAVSPVGPVRFAAPDGSALEIIPERSTAERIVAERPPHAAIAGVKHGRIRPANEGCLRLAFDGPNALDRGLFMIRFHGPTP